MRRFLTNIVVEMRGHAAVRLPRHKKAARRFAALARSAPPVTDDL
jgi:hypothetical protein